MTSLHSQSSPFATAVVPEGAQQYSCLPCQRRKAKCDKQLPSCSTCPQRGIDCEPCIVAPQHRRPRQKRFPEAQLLARIRKYEALLRNAGISPDPDDGDDDDDEAHLRPSSTLQNHHNHSHATPAKRRRSGSSTQPDPDTTLDVHLTQAQSPADHLTPDVGHMESILLRANVQPASCPPPHHQHHAHYKPNYDGPTPHTSTVAAAAETKSVSSNSMIFQHLDRMYSDDGSQYLVFDDHLPGQPLPLPPTSVMFRLLHVYQQNVHPVMKFVHHPTVYTLLCDISASPSHATLGPTSLASMVSHHALLWAIFSLAIHSIPENYSGAIDQQHQSLFGPGKTKQQAQLEYRRNTQTALYRAKLWTATNLSTLQAYLLYLLSLTRDADPRILSCFMGTAVRMGRRLGIHRPPRPLKPTQPTSRIHLELQKRLWWELVIWDMRAAEKSGISIDENFDCGWPSGATDDDLGQDPHHLPWQSSPQQQQQSSQSIASLLAQDFRSDRQSISRSSSSASLASLDPAEIRSNETRFFLIRCELGALQMRPPWMVVRTESKGIATATVPLSLKLAFIDRFEAIAEQRYLLGALRSSQYLSTSPSKSTRSYTQTNARFNTSTESSFDCFVHLYTRMSLAKLRMVAVLNDNDTYRSQVDQSTQSASKAAEIETKDQSLLRLCLIQIEAMNQLVGDAALSRFRWFKYANLPFFSYIILLDLLRRHPTGKWVEECWQAVDASKVIWRPDLADTIKNKQDDRSSSHFDNNIIYHPHGSDKGTLNGSAATGQTREEIAASAKTMPMAAKFRVRGAMFSSLLIAAWERRAEALRLQNQQRRRRQSSGANGDANLNSSAHQDDDNDEEMVIQEPILVAIMRAQVNAPGSSLSSYARDESSGRGVPSNIAQDQDQTTSIVTPSSATALTPATWASTMDVSSSSSSQNVDGLASWPSRSNGDRPTSTTTTTTQQSSSSQDISTSAPPQQLGAGGGIASMETIPPLNHDQLADLEALFSSSVDIDWSEWFQED